MTQTSRVEQLWKEGRRSSLEFPELKTYHDPRMEDAAALDGAAARGKVSYQE